MPTSQWGSSRRARTSSRPRGWPPSRTSTSGRQHRRLRHRGQTLLSGGTCKNYYNWAKGAGSGIAGTGEGKIQSWIDFGFWFKPPTSRFYSVRPLFRFRGYIIVSADDSWYNSKYARVTGSAWTNVHQYNWKGWNHVNVYNAGGPTSA